MRLSALLLTLLAVCGTALAAQEKKELSCDELGFTAEASCSDCDTLEEFVKDEELVADCHNCCTRESTDVKKYSKAELIIDQWRYNSLPQIKDFVEKRAKAYEPALKVTFAHGASPKLRLSGSAGSEAVRIDNWKAANIAEFLDERLDLNAKDEPKKYKAKDVTYVMKNKKK